MSQHFFARAAAGSAAVCLSLIACNTAPASNGLPVSIAPASSGSGVSGATSIASAGNAGPTTPVVAGATGAQSAPSAGSGPGDIPNLTGPAGTGGTAVPVGGATAGSIAAAGGTGGAAPNTPSDAADWPMMGYDIGSTYFNRAETLLSKDTAARLDVAWTADMGGNVYGGALQIADKIYATAPGSVRCFDAASGMELWKTTIGSTSTLSYSEGTLYINSNDAKVVAFNAADGKMLWSKPHDTQESDGSSSPIPAGDLLVIGGSNGSAELTGGGTFRGYLSGLDRKTGDIVWTTYTVPQGSRGASIWSTPSVDLTLGLAFGGTGNNYGTPATDTSDSIIAFDLKTGAIKWKNQRVKNDTFGAGIGPDSDFGANPVVYDTLVGGVMTKLIADGNKGGQVVALKREDGSELWTRSLCTGSADGSNGIFTNFAWAGKNLIVACNQGGPATLYGLDGATGDIAWMRALQGQVFGRTAVANGVGFVGTGTTLEAFDVDTGAVIKSFKSKGGTIASTITISKGRVAFGEGLSWSSGVGGRTLTVLAIK